MKHSVKLLLAAAILVLCGSAMTPLRAQNLLLHYKFDSASGSSVPDVSGNGRAGEVSGSATLAALPDHPKKYGLNNTASAMGKAAANSGGSLRYSGPGLGELKSFTVTMWFKQTGQTLVPGVRFFDFSGITDDVLFGANSANGNVALNCGVKKIAGNGTPKSLLTSTDEWLFLAVVYDGTNEKENVRLFLGSATQPANFIALGTTERTSWNFNGPKPLFVFGANSQNGRALSGWMTDIRIYGDATSSTGAMDRVQIQEIQASGNPTTP